MLKLICTNCRGDVQATKKDYWDVTMDADGVVTAVLPEGWDSALNFPVWDIYCASDCEANPEWGSGGRLFQDAESLQLAIEDLLEQGFIEKA
jgi:hypothetical protein